RAAALTPERAAALVTAPEQETSWHVLHAAARMAKVAAWKLEPSPPWQPPARTVSLPEPLSVTVGDPPNARRLGPDGLLGRPVGPLRPARRGLCPRRRARPEPALLGAELSDAHCLLGSPVSVNAAAAALPRGHLRGHAAEAARRRRARPAHSEGRANRPVH